jgi:hypothetical protein
MGYCSPKQKREYKRQYYLRKREYLRELRKLHYNKNKVSTAQQAHSYYIANKNEISNYRRIHYSKNRDHYLRLNKNNYIKNKSRRLQLGRESKERSFENFIRYLYSGVKSRGLKYGKISISVKDIINLYYRQKGLCAISLVKMSHKLNSSDAISIDRIDSCRGYDIDNIQLICQFINLGKKNRPNEEVIKFIQQVKGGAK